MRYDLVDKTDEDDQIDGGIIHSGDAHSSQIISVDENHHHGSRTANMDDTKPDEAVEHTHRVVINIERIKRGSYDHVGHIEAECVSLRTKLN